MERLGGGGRRSTGESGGHQEALMPLSRVPFLFVSYWDCPCLGGGGVGAPFCLVIYCHSSKCMQQTRVIGFVVKTQSKRFDASGGVSLTRGRPPLWQRSDHYLKSATRGPKKQFNN